MSDELERRREECLQLRAMLADKSISTHSVAKQSYGGQDEIVNEDNELTMAYKSQRDIIRCVKIFLALSQGASPGWLSGKCVRLMTWWL